MFEQSGRQEKMGGRTDGRKTKNSKLKKEKGWRMGKNPDNRGISKMRAQLG